MLALHLVHQLETATVITYLKLERGSNAEDVGYHKRIRTLITERYGSIESTAQWGRFET